VKACYTIAVVCRLVEGNWRKQLINHLLIWRIYKFGGINHGEANKVISKVGVLLIFDSARGLTPPNRERNSNSLWMSFAIGKCKFCSLSTGAIFNSTLNGERHD